MAERSLLAPSPPPWCGGEWLWIPGTSFLEEEERRRQSHHAHHTPLCPAASSSSRQEQKSKGGRAGIAEPLKSKMKAHQ